MARQRSAWTWVAVAVVGSVCIGGVVLPRLVGSGSSAERPAAAAQPATVLAPTEVAAPSTTESAANAVDDGPVTPVTVAGPSSATWGVPLGFPQSPGGVRAAAVTWVSSLGTLLAQGPIARNETLAQLLSERAYVETVEDLRAERDRFVSAFRFDPSQLVWLEAPLAVEIVSAESTRAVLEVWSVLLFGSTTERVESLYRTHTVTLLWERDSWRVDDVTRHEGPTPLPADAMLPSPGSEFSDVTSWTPAVFAGTSMG